MFVVLGENWGKLGKLGKLGETGDSHQFPAGALPPDVPSEARGAPDGGVSARANWVGGAEGLGGDRIPSTGVLGYDAGAPTGAGPLPCPLPKERVKAQRGGAKESRPGRKPGHQRRTDKPGRPPPPARE